MRRIISWAFTEPSYRERLGLLVCAGFGIPTAAAFGIYLQSVIAAAIILFSFFGLFFAPVAFCLAEWLTPRARAWLAS